MAVTEDDKRRVPPSSPKGTKKFPKQTRKYIRRIQRGGVSARVRRAMIRQRTGAATSYRSRVQQLQTTLQQRARDRIARIIQQRSQVQDAQSLRDIAAQDRLAAIQEEMKARQTISEEQQQELDLALQNKVNEVNEGSIQYDTSFYTKQDLEVLQKQARDAAQATVDALRQKAIDQSRAFAAVQIARLVNLSAAERAARLQERERQIRSDEARYLREREISMLQWVKEECALVTTQAQVKQAQASQFLTQQIRPFIPILKTRVEFAAEQVNRATAYLSKSVIDALYDIQRKFDNQSSLYLQISNFVATVNGLRAELQRRIGTIQSKDASIPALLQLRQSLMNQLPALLTAVNAAYLQVLASPNPSREATRVFEFLQGQQRAIEKELGRLEDDMRALVALAPGKLQGYNSATQARIDAQVALQGVIQSVIQASQAQINEFNVTLIDTMQDTQDLLASARDLRGKRDGFEGDANTQLGFYNFLRLTTLPGMRTVFETYDQTVYAPKQTDRDSAYGALQGTQASIDGMNEANRLDREYLADVVIPYLRNGFPLKSDRLKFLEQYIPYLQDALDVYLPRLLTDAGISYTNAAFIANEIWERIKPGSDLYTRLKADEASSSDSVQYYQSLTQFLNGLYARVGGINIQIVNWRGILDTLRRPSSKEEMSQYILYFRAQKNYFSGRVLAVRGTKDTARLAAVRDTTSGSQAISIASTLDGRTRERTTALQKIDILNDLVVTTRTSASRYSIQGKVVSLETTLESFKTDTMGPLERKIRTIGDQYAEALRQRGVFDGQYRGYKTPRDTAFTTYTTADGTLSRLKGRRTGLENEKNFAIFTRDNYKDLLGIRKVRSSAYTIVSQLMTFYSGNLTDIRRQQSDFSGPKITARGDAATARQQALAAGVTQISSDLAQKTNDLVPVNTALQSYQPANYLTLFRTYQDASTRFRVLQNLLGVAMRSDNMIVFYSGLYEITKQDMRTIEEILRAYPNITEMLQDMARVYIQLESTRDKRDDTYSDYSIAKKVLDDQLRPDLYFYDEENRKLYFYQQNLRDTLFTISKKAMYKKNFGDAIDMYRSSKDSYRTIRLNKNQQKVNNQVFGASYMATSDFFQTATDLDARTRDAASLDLRTIEDQTSEAQALSATASSNFARMKAMKQEIDTRRSVAAITGTLSQASTTYTTYVDQTVEPKVGDVQNYTENKDVVGSLESDLAAAKIRRDTAEATLNDATGTRSRLQFLINFFVPLRDLLRVEFIRTASRDAMQTMIDTYRASRDLFRGRKDTAAGVKPGAKSDADTGRAAALAVDFTGTASELDQRTKELKDQVEPLLGRLNSEIVRARFLADLATGRKTKIALDTFETEMGTLIQNLADIQTAIEGIPIGSDSAALDAAKADLANLITALNTARESLRTADTNLTNAKQDKGRVEDAKRALLETQERLRTLLAVYNSFYETINDRNTQKSMLQGLIGYYRGLMGRMNTAKTTSGQNKTNAAALADKSSFNQNVEAILDLSQRLDENMILDGVTKARIEQTLTLVNVWTNVRNDATMKKIQDKTDTLRSLMQNLLDAQTKLEDVLRTIEDLESIIRDLGNKLNDSALSDSSRQDLLNQIELMLKTRTFLYGEIRRLKNDTARLRERINQLLDEINGLRQLYKNLRNRLPVMFFLPVGVTLGILAPILVFSLLPTPYVPREPTKKPDETNCEEAKQRGYQDGFAKGAEDGFKRGYEDAKKQFQKDRNAAYLANLQSQGQEAAPPPEEEEAQTQVQAGGAAVEDDPYAEKEPEQASEQQLYQLPANYTVPIPDRIPTPTASQIVVPQLAGVSPKYQFCYEEGYIAGYKEGFNSTYLKGFKSFIPSQEAFLPLIQKDEEAEEKAAPPTQDDFGYAPPAASVGPAVPTDDRVAPAQVYPAPQMDEAYRAQYAQIDRSQFP